MERSRALQLAARVAIVGLLAAAVLGTVVVPALAVEPTVDEAVKTITEGEVYKEKCTWCHVSIAEYKSSEIRFSHGAHSTYACSACHGEFAHIAGQSSKPIMKDCFNCHGLNHGPLGETGSGICTDCHLTRKESLRPAFHTWDWAGTPHVPRGEKETNTTCMMCHEPSWCDDCHQREGIDWKPQKAYRYDPQQGCLACHGNSLLQKASSTGPHSYYVTGLDETAHRDLGCTECHQDFKWEETANATKMWKTNAGLACQGCHSKNSENAVVAKDERLQVAAAYSSSVHGTELVKGNIKTATCAGCHGGHQIERTDTAAARTRLHLASQQMCGKSTCHESSLKEIGTWENYNDYYHGAAYKAGAADAPACWDCHGAHDVLPKGDPKSKVSAANIPASCNDDIDGVKCHEQHVGSSENFTEAAVKMIHGKDEIRDANWLVKQVSNLTGWMD